MAGLGVRIEKCSGLFVINFFSDIGGAPSGLANFFFIRKKMITNNLICWELGRSECWALGLGGSALGAWAAGLGRSGWVLGCSALGGVGVGGSGRGLVCRCR